MTSDYLVLSALQLRAAAASGPAPVALYNNLWHEGRLACLLGENSAVNTEAAIDIAATVAASGRRVLFVDFRDSVRAFLDRCGDDIAGNIFRVGIDLASLDPHRHDYVMKNIERAVADCGAEVCVVDSLSLLCDWHGKTDSARLFARLFSSMGSRLRISILLAATPRKRIGKEAPCAAHLPRHTEPFFKEIIPAVEKEPGESSSPEAVAGPEAPAEPSSSEKSEASAGAGPSSCHSEAPSSGPTEKSESSAGAGQPPRVPEARPSEKSETSGGSGQSSGSPKCAPPLRKPRRKRRRK